VSRSSIRQRLESIVAPAAVAGITFGQGRLSFVRLERASGTWRCLTAEDVALPVLAFERPPAPEAIQVISEALARLVPDARRAYLPLQVTLPDPLGYIGALELDTLPKSSATRRELVRWHFERDLHLNAVDYEFDHQDLGMNGNVHLLLGQSLDKPWLEVIRHALNNASLHVWNINTTFCRHYNTHYPMLTSGHAGAGLITLDADTWSFGFFDAEGRVRFVRSRWRRRDEQFSESFAVEIESTVRSYVHGGKGRDIRQLFLVGDELDTASLAEGLNPRLGSPCVRLTARAYMPDVPAKFYTDAQFILSALVGAV
jgi:hypothetical protein